MQEEYIMLQKELLNILLLVEQQRLDLNIQDGKIQYWLKPLEFMFSE